LLLWNAPALCGLLPPLALFARQTAKAEALRYGRPLLALSAMLAFLLLGAVRDGVPTHHAARVLLPIWFFGCVVAGHLWPRLARGVAGQARAAITLGALTASLFLLAPGLSHKDFADRALEIEAGRAARQHTNEALAIDTPDYGFFAIQAAFGSPRGTSVLDEHDPRHPIVSPFRSAEVLAQALREKKARFVIVTTEHAPLLRPQCVTHWSNERYVLCSCAANPS
jgi:hypothetical protein